MQIQETGGCRSVARGFPIKCLGVSVRILRRTYVWEKSSQSIIMDLQANMLSSSLKESTLTPCQRKFHQRPSFNGLLLKASVCIKTSRPMSRQRPVPKTSLFSYIMYYHNALLESSGKQGNMLNNKNDMLVTKQLVQLKRQLMLQT